MELVANTVNPVKQYRLELGPRRASDNKDDINTFGLQALPNSQAAKPVVSGCDSGRLKVLGEIHVKEVTSETLAYFFPNGVSSLVALARPPNEDAKPMV